MKIAHIINPVKVPATSDLYVAQPVTFRSIQVARDFALNEVDVALYAIGYPEDHEIMPPHFTVLPDLKRSVLDLHPFSRAKKLPLIADILQALNRATDADYLIYSNADIALMPHFYTTVALELQKGADALIINRRGLSAQYKSVNDLPAMYADEGVPHPGYDCFVFKRQLTDKFILAGICIGIPFSEVTLTHNLIAFARQPKFLDTAHLTFHIGTEVMTPRDTEYYQYNRNQYETLIYPQLKPHLQIGKFPYALLPFHKRMVKWMLNPVFRTHQVAELEGKGWLRNMKHRFDAVRFGLLHKIK
jgi:hypothetical protein